jgi:hypothetical protein
MKYPTKLELISYINRDFEEFCENGLKAKQALSRLKYEYEHLASKSNEYKVIILTHLYELGQKHGFEYTSVLDELKTLGKQSLRNKVASSEKGPIKKLELGEENLFKTLATIG